MDQGCEEVDHVCLDLDLFAVRKSAPVKAFPDFIIYTVIARLLAMSFEFDGRGWSRVIIAHSLPTSRCSECLVMLMATAPRGTR